MKSIYLDNSTITRPSERALNRMIPILSETWGHPSQPHSLGQKVIPTVKSSLEAIYQALGVDPQSHCIFTSSGAEAINHAIWSGYMDVMLPSGKTQFITSIADEAPTMMAMSRLERLGATSRLAPIDKRGRVTAEAIGDLFSPRTAMVSLSWANGMTGVIHPIEEIAEVCKERGVRLHVDLSHVLGKLHLDLKNLPIAYATFDGSLLHAPRGSGILYAKEDITLSPFIAGGLEQGGFRAGCPDIAAFAALGEALQETIETRDLLNTETARMRDQLENGILAGFPDAIICFQKEERLPHISLIAFPGIVNEALLYALSRQGVYACIGGGSHQQVSLHLTATGIDKELACTAVNYTLSRETTDEEIEKTVEIIVSCAKKLRKVSGSLVSGRAS